MPVGQGGGRGGRRATVRSQLESVAELRSVQCTFSEPSCRYGGIFKAKELPAERVALDRLGPAIVQVEWSPAQQAGDADAAAGEDTAEHTEA